MTYPGPAAEAVLQQGDTVVCDETGMLDQDTALTLLTVADEHSARLALVGDRHQLPAIGRGGVLDLAHRWCDQSGTVTLDTLHRFTDPDYAELTLQIRAGIDPGAVFDQLHARGLIRIHADDDKRRRAVRRLHQQALGRRQQPRRSRRA